MIEVLLCAAMGWCLVNIFHWNEWFRVMNRKPFNCEKCCAGWLSLWLCWHGWMTPFWMALAIVTTIILTGLVKRLSLF